VLLKDAQEKRNDWPVGIITKTYPSEDGKFRKIEVKIIKVNKDSSVRYYLLTSPITD